MKVDRNHLCFDDGRQVEFKQSPNHGPGELVAPALIVIHWTGGSSFENACAWLTSPRAKASAHLVIGREGQVAQLARFDQRAWHAGASEWTIPNEPPTMRGLNQFSIGIELVNPGPLQQTAVGWKTINGTPVGGDDVVIAEHKHGGGKRAFHAYTEAQILTAYEACEGLIDAFPSIKDVVGHDDIAPKRKSDPGPAWPMEAFRGWLFGRGQG